jgi:glutamine amidotransferase
MIIAIIDYGVGNVKSIRNAFENQEAEVILTRERETILKADGLVLPGVGAFSHGMDNLNKYGLVEIIKDFVKTGKPLLGICLGMQMLLEESEEFGITKGIGLIKGKVIKLPVEQSINLKLPHISWNEILPKSINWQDTILDNIEENTEVYFVHTFIAKPDNENEILSITKYYDEEFCSSIKKGNIYGCQFHPEKSSKKGLSIIKNFIKIVKL